MFAWAQMQRLALRQLRLKPWEFWALTPFEFLMMLGLDQGAAVMNRTQLSNLMDAFPDAGPDTGPDTGPNSQRD